MTIALAVVAAVLAVAVGAYAFTLYGDDGADRDPAIGTSTTVAPTDGSTNPTTAAPLSCGSASGRCSGITGVTIADGTYVASYEVVGFDPLIFRPEEQGTAEDHHVHFFFDTTAPEDAGSNGNPPGDWQIWDRPLGGGELRFDGYRVGDEAEATRLCIAVADAGHAVERDSGACVDLPTDGAVAPAAWRRPAEDVPAAATTADWCGPRAEGEAVA